MMVLFPLFFKIFLAAVIGGGIGLEREIKERGAGLKTNGLVCVGACVYTIVSMSFSGSDFDPSRVAAQIVSGIGFLGIGVIVKTGGKVEGITTAAVLWVVAALGMAIGIGSYLLAIFGFLFTLLILILFLKIELYLEKRKKFF